MPKRGGGGGGAGAGIVHSISDSLTNVTAIVRQVPSSVEGVPRKVPHRTVG